MTAVTRHWYAILLTALVGCSERPKLDVESLQGQADIQSKILVDEGTRVASRREYQGLLKENASGLDERVMLDQLLGVTQSITKDSLVAGNDARLLIDGPETFKVMFADIDKAKQHIHLETFILEDDEIGQKLADKLIASRARGVTVRVLIDAFGSMGLPEEFLERMRQAGIQLRKFHPINPADDPRVWRGNNRNHRKTLIVDGRVAYAGGINFSEVYGEGSFSVPRQARKTDSAWRDTHVRITGPVVRKFQQQFLDIWNKDIPKEERVHGEKYLPALDEQGDMLVGVIASTGGEGEESDVYSTLLAAIGHAQKKVWITQAYFAPDEAFLAAIKLAAKRGVDVKLLLPGVSDAPLVIQASRSNYQDLLETGVHIYERNGSTLHAKTVVVDGVWSTVGSTNFDYRSFVHNYELNAVIVSQDFGHEMEKLYRVDLQHADEITLQAWQDRPIFQRIKEGVGGLMKAWL